MTPRALDIVKAQAKKIAIGTVYYIHLPNEMYIKNHNIKKRDYLVWEINGRGQLILRKLR